MTKEQDLLVLIAHMTLEMYLDSVAKRCFTMETPVDLAEKEYNRRTTPVMKEINRLQQAFILESRKPKKKAKTKKVRRVNRRSK